MNILKWFKLKKKRREAEKILFVFLDDHMIYAKIDNHEKKSLYLVNGIVRLLTAFELERIIGFDIEFIINLLKSRLRA